MPTLTPRLILLSLLAGLVLLPGCGTAPIGQPTEALDGQQAMSRGKYEEAARAFQYQAMQAGPEQASALWISAADAWMKARDIDQARDALRWVDKQVLSSAEMARLNLVLADLALTENRPDEAEALLQKAAAFVPSNSRARYEELFARLEQQVAGPASQDLSRAARLSDTMRFYDPAAAVELMQMLESVSSGELAVRALNPRGERQLTGWLDLALVIRNNLVEPEEVEAAIAEWKSRHPSHVLTQTEALDTWLRYRQRFQAPRRVAVVLPTDGRLQAAGMALRDGLISAWAENPGGSDLLFFSSGDDPQEAISAYYNALDAGADLIIGPLREESVAAVLGLEGLATPMLCLNDLPGDYRPPAGLEGQVTGISLSQDTEARAVGIHAASQGFGRAMVLAPESAWGERMAAGFMEGFLQDDQQIVTSIRYLETENDDSAVMERALKIDESKARAQRLENTLQTQIEFEPVRRQDIDVIFMPVQAAKARQLRPQLRFHDAGDIPVYATGRVYSGEPDPALNRDLNGIRFPAGRWYVEHPDKADLPDVASLNGGRLASLFALGQDAWNLLPWLPLMHRDPGFRFTGQSGDYTDIGRGTLLREPSWAVFKNGRSASLPVRSDGRGG
ncbi:MAG: hypothetical protein HKO85_05470 [Xanthomonadales bacterium]|nr:penicillin-binding protein activator [Gammaproteobacteria bacterium]MBT8055380.1 penicillin-binding protein activator [Gammaproteobacteria bacterium]NNL04719.1 hypothetical protein [Xanthomonadales bacterium]